MKIKETLQFERDPITSQLILTVEPGLRKEKKE